MGDFRPTAPCGDSVPGLSLLKIFVSHFPNRAGAYEVKQTFRQM